MVKPWSNNIKNNIEHWLYPARCVLCAKAGEGRRDLCTACLADLPYNVFACSQCALPLTVPGTRDPICGRCQKTPPAYNHSFSLFVYAHPVDYLIQRLKFNAKLSHARLLGELMATHLKQQVEILPEVIIPVPLHRSRLRERGYNQALEIARPIASQLAIRINYRSTVRLRATSAQSDLPAKERHGNVKGAFGVVNPINARHVAIVDDVMTTGHTVQEFAAVLRRSGVEVIDTWVVARAVQHS